MRKIRSLIKAGKVFGKDGAPQMQRADREIATGSGWSCPQEFLARVSLARVYFLSWWPTEGLIGTWGPTSIQRVTRHKNTLIGSRCQNTTYSPVKADPPGTQCTKLPWWSSHFKCYYFFGGVHSCQTFLPLAFVVTECQMVDHHFFYKFSKKVYRLLLNFSFDFLCFICLPFSPPVVGAAVVCFCVSYEGPMFPRSFRDVRGNDYIH